MTPPLDHSKSAFWLTKKSFSGRLSFLLKQKKDISTKVSYCTTYKEEHHCGMIGNSDHLFNDTKLKMMSESYEVNLWVLIFGCGRGRVVKASEIEFETYQTLRKCTQIYVLSKRWINCPLQNLHCFELDTLYCNSTWKYVCLSMLKDAFKARHICLFPYHSA